jgi:hypothetical protein
MHHWDERFQWGQKAKILLDEGGIRSAGFQAADRPHLHRHYPLLVPAVEAHVARLAGGFGQERAVKAIFPCLFAALVLVLHAALRSRLAEGTALAITLLFAALPPFHASTLIQGGSAHTGFADVPLAAFGLAALVLLLEAGRPEAGPLSGDGENRSRALVIAAGLCGGFALLAKPEGIAVAAGTVLAAGLAVRAEGLRSRLRYAAMALLAVAPLAVPQAALTFLVPTTGTVGFTADEAYLARLSIAGLGQGASANLPSALRAMAAAPFSLRWALFGLFPLAALGLRRPSGRRPGDPPATLVALPLIVLPLAADLLAYTFTGSDIAWHLTVSLDRLWMQVVAPVILCAAFAAGTPDDRTGAPARN